MFDRTFLDTNVLVYAFDNANPAKQECARQILSSPPGPLAVSAQVIGEFYVVVTRKLAEPLDLVSAETAVTHLRRLPVVPVDADLADAAAVTSREHQLSYWDALIVEAAIAAGCHRLFTEDLDDGARFRTLSVENPFT